MPTHEAVISTVIPQTTQPTEKLIPTRVVSTRSTLKPQSTDQLSTSRSVAGVEESIPTAESVKLSPQLSALARKEQAYRQREQALKVREKDLEAKLADAEQYSQLKTKLSSKDYSEAERLGLSYEGYTKYLLDKQSGEDPQTQAFRALEAEVQALKKSKEDSATQEYEETVAEYRKEIESLVSTSSEFLRVKKLGRTDAVLQLILDSWEEDGTEMTVEQASRDVESYLMNLAKDLDVSPPEAERKLPPPKVGSSRTLNQHMAAVGTDAGAVKSLQKLSESERYAEARRRVLARREKGI